MYIYIILLSLIILIIFIIIAKIINNYWWYKLFYKLYIFETASNDIIIANKFNTNNNNKIISLSLFGDNPYYYNHAYKMKDDLSIFFPNWELRIYIHYKTPIFVIKNFIEKGCQVIIIQQDNMTPSDCTFWRFLPAQDNVVFLSRDVDYQLNYFDYEQATKWINEDNTYFIKYLQTNSVHKTKISLIGIKLFQAGFWGGRNRCVPNMLEKINNFKYRRHWMKDEIFLENIIWEEDIKKKGITIVFDYKMEKIYKKFIQPYIKIRQLEYDNPMNTYLKSQSIIGSLIKLFKY